MGEGHTSPNVYQVSTPMNIPGLQPSGAAAGKSSQKFDLPQRREPVVKLDAQTVIALQSLVSKYRKSNKFRLMARKMTAIVAPKFPQWNLKILLANEMARAVYGETTFIVTLNGHLDSILFMLAKLEGGNDNG